MDRREFLLRSGVIGIAIGDSCFFSALGQLPAHVVVLLSLGGQALVVLLQSDLRAVAAAITLSRATLAVIRQNLVFAFGYNLLAVPLAASGALHPMWAGAAMAASSVSVVTNSLRLRRVVLRDR